MRHEPKKAENPSGAETLDSRQNGTEHVQVRTGADAGDGAPELVVGIGASAGGFQPMTALLEQLPAEAGMAVFVVQHRDPSYASSLMPLLSGRTSLSVVDATDGLAIQPNHIYVIPPRGGVSLENGRIRLTEPSGEEALPRPIDAVLKRLADQYGDRAIGIVLSGTGRDGVRGVRAIRAGGGLTMAQDPAEAEQSAMPSAAVQSGAVDLVLPADKMAAKLQELAKRIRERPLPEQSPDAERLKEVIEILRTRVGHDFAGYRKKTLIRRIERRIRLFGLETLPQYVEHLRRGPDEAGELFSDMLIGVTTFFRDPAAWQELAQKVIDPLLKIDNATPPVRIWVPGCANGREAYTLAMLFADAMERIGSGRQAQIFATDVHRESLALGRAALYPLEIAEEIPEHFLSRFFTCERAGYRVVERLREMVTFAPQNVLSDPPFARLDLISCRNLLIYLEPETQSRLLKFFHFALREDGFLFLGGAESVSRELDLFSAVSKESRIYRKLGASQTDVWTPALPAGGKTRSTRWRSGPELARPDLAPPKDLLEKTLLEQTACAAVLVDPHYQVTWYYGDLDPYLRFPTGQPTNDLLTLARDGLRTRLRVAVSRAFQKREAMSIRGAVTDEDSVDHVRVTVLPVAERNFVVVKFDPDEAATDSPHEYPESDHWAIKQLENEVQATREELQDTIEELEASNEELRVANQEVMSTNEELQSTNEELETSREELQSVNQELASVNLDLEDKIDELERTGSHLENILHSTEVATVFLDPQLNLSFYTPAAELLLGLNEEDVGRPVQGLDSDLIDDALLRDARSLLSGVRFSRKQVRDGEGRWFVRSVLPYRTQRKAVRGVVVTFVDVTPVKLAEQEADANLKQLNALIETMDQGLVIAEPNGKVVRMNQAALDIHDYDSLEQAVMELPRFTETFELARLDGTPLPLEQWPLARVLAGEQFSRCEVRVRRKDTGRIWIGSYSGAPVRDDEGNVLLAFVTLRDVTEQRRAEREIREAHDRINQILESITDAFVSFDADWHYTYANESALKMLDVSREDLLGNVIWEAFPALTGSIFEEKLREAAASGEGLHFEGYYPPLEKWFYCRCYPSGRQLSVFFLDITEAKQAQMALQESEALALARASELKAVMDTAPVAIMIAEGVACESITANPAGCEMLGLPPDSNVSLSAPEQQRTADYTVHQHGRQLEPHELPLQRAARGETVEEEEYEIRTDQATVHIFGSAVPLYDGSGETRGAVAAFLDITDRKETEQQLAELNRTLEQRVSDRTQMIRRQAIQLRDLTMQLTQAEQRERRRLARVLHDGLQQLLVGAKYNIRAIERAGVDPKLARKLIGVTELIDQSIESARHLTLELSPPVLYDAGLRYAIEWLAEQMKVKHGLTVRFDSDVPGGAVPESVRVLLFDILRELLLNVVKHSGADSAEVGLHGMEDGAFRLTVHDGGHGFDISSLGQHASSERFGLFSVRQRVESVSGRVSIDSRPGEGTTIAVVTPGHADSSMAGAAAHPDTRPEPETTGSDEEADDAGGRRIRVLVVDDHQMVREGLIGVVEQEDDMDVVGEAANGREAMEMADELKPDVIVMDVNMPEMNGIEATREITAVTDRVRIVGLSVQNDSALVKSMKEAGASSFVPKDAMPEDLHAAIRTAYDSIGQPETD